MYLTVVVQYIMGMIKPNRFTVVIAEVNINWWHITRWLSRLWLANLTVMQITFRYANDMLDIVVKYILLSQVVFCYFSVFNI